MRIAFFSPRNFLDKVADGLGRLGHDVFINPKNSSGFDAVLLMSVTQMPQVFRMDTRNLFVYEWDIYDWAMKTPRKNEYDYRRFLQVCASAKEVWVPSVAEKVRYDKLRRQDRPEGVVVKSTVPYWDLLDIAPTDGGFVLDTLRETPDPHWGIGKAACESLNIPFVYSKHVASWEEYCKLLASCTFTVCTLREASTGGLGLVEAAWYGKPVLVPNNDENAAKEYWPGAFRFAAGDLNDLKEKIGDLWKNRWQDSIAKNREKIHDVFNPDRMAGAIDARLKANL